VSGDRPADPGGSPVAKVAGRVTALVDAAYATRPGRFGKEVMDRTGAAGGGVTANGLAYSAIFTIVPTLLILASIIGVFISDAAERERIVEIIATQIPPLEDLIRTVLNEIAAGAVAFGILGILGAVWGASRFYAALDQSAALFFPLAPRRDLVRQTLESLLSVGFFVGSALGAVALATGVSALDVLPRPEAEPIVRRLVAAVAMTAWFTLALALVYRFVPSLPVRWRDSLPPSIAAGLAISVVTQVFVLVAPIFLSGLRFYGTFIAIFAALIWLSLCCQIVVYGLAWLAMRLGAPVPTLPGAGPRGRSEGASSRPGDQTAG
jgi:membrane protein